MRFQLIFLLIGRNKLINNLFFLIFLFVICISSPRAQEFHNLVGDYPFATSLELDSLYSGTIQENIISGSHNFSRVKNSKLGVFGRYFELANSKLGVPNYYNIQFGASYRHYFDNDKSLGIMASLGSSSDEPFKNGRDGTILINSTYQLNEKWVILGNYSNNRTFLNNVPIPGFIYVQKQSREETVMLGFPFIYFLKPFYKDKFSVKFIGILPYNHKFRILYNKMQFVKPYVGIEQGPLVFFDSDRSSEDVRTFWFERKAALGFEKSFGPFLKIDFQVGNSFDREYFNAKSFGRQHTEVKKIHDGSYVSLSLKSSF